LLTDEVSIAMPPIPLEYQGREAVARFFVDIGRQGRHYDAVPTRANGQLALGSTSVPPPMAAVAPPASTSSPSPATRSPR
jgi:hypothetical protein